MANTIVSYLRTNSVQIVWFLSESLNGWLVCLLVSVSTVYWALTARWRLAVAIRLHKHGWTFSFILPAPLSVERKCELQKRGVTETCLLCLFSLLIWVCLSATEWGRAQGMAFWPSGPCSFHTPSSPTGSASAALFAGPPSKTPCCWLFFDL